MDSNDISGALGKLLEDPAALAKAMSIAQSLMSNMPQGASSEAKGAPSDEAAPAAVEAFPTNVQSDAQNQNAAHAQSEAPSVAELAQLLGAGAGKSDPRCALLYALKPYMGHGREDKIDTLVSMLKLARLAEGMLGGKLF